MSVLLDSVKEGKKCVNGLPNGHVSHSKAYGEYKATVVKVLRDLDYSFENAREFEIIELARDEYEGLSITNIYRFKRPVCHVRLTRYEYSCCVTIHPGTCAEID